MNQNRRADLGIDRLIWTAAREAAQFIVDGMSESQAIAKGLGIAMALAESGHEGYSIKTCENVSKLTYQEREERVRRMVPDAKCDISQVSAAIEIRGGSRSRLR